VSSIPDGPALEERPISSRGFAAAKIAVVLDDDVRDYVLSQRARLPQSKSASALIRDLLREHRTLQETVAAQARRLHLLELALDRARRR